MVRTVDVPKDSHKPKKVSINNLLLIPEILYQISPFVVTFSSNS